MTSSSPTIRTLNDALRTTFTGGQIMLTHGIQSLGGDAVAAILSKVRSFNRFNEDNDPYGEHDFGAVDHAGNKVIWKIAYYDPTLTSGSDDPADPVKTARVLTIMLAEEY